MENIFYIFRAINLFFSKTAKSAAKNKPLAIAFVALLASGFFIINYALAVNGVMITPASGGVNISIDTTSATGGTGTFKSLSGPGITETTAGNISIGLHTIQLPSGYEFDTSSPISVVVIGDIGLTSTSIIPNQTSFTFEVTNISSSPSIIGFSNLKVRPTGIIAPSSGNITYSGSGIVSVDGNTNFGTLSLIPGAVKNLAFSTQPAGSVYGEILSQQPVVKTQDQFGNNSVNGLAESKIVSISLTSGSGSLIGTTEIDIGTGSGNGTASFSDLSVNNVGPGKVLSVTADGLIGVSSDSFEITVRNIEVTADNKTKVYGETDLGLTYQITYGSLVGSDAFTGNITRDSGEDVGDYSIKKGDLTLSENYNLSFIPASFTITPKALSVSGISSILKTYDGNTTAGVDFSTTSLVGIVEGDEGSVTLNPSSYSASFDNKNVETGKTVTVSGLTLDGAKAGNYSLTQPTLNDGVITPKTLTVTATGIDKEYDGTTNATVTLSDDRVLGDDLTLGYTSALFTDKDVANDKSIDVTGIIMNGVDAENYSLSSDHVTAYADINKKHITASLILQNKTYDGDTGATYSGDHVQLVGVISGDEVLASDGVSKSFADKNVGENKLVTALGIVLSGVDSGNYDFDGIGTGTATISKRPIIVTAVSNKKIYDGTAVSLGIPDVTPDGFATAIQTGDTAEFSQVFDNKNVGVGKTLTPSGLVDDENNGNNYSYTFVSVSTGEITIKSIEVTAQSDTKVYDGTNASSVPPKVDNLEGEDFVGTIPTQTYDNAIVGTGKTLTASGLVIDDGNGGANYEIHYIIDSTGEITEKELTVTGASSVEKIYDGNTNAEVNFGSASLVGIVEGDEGSVTLNPSSYSASFDNKNVETGKTVTVSGLTLDGAKAGNYSLTQPTLNDGVITPKTLTVTATGIDKEYDGTTNATVTLSDDRVEEDVLTPGYTSAAFEDKNIGTEKTVTVSGITKLGTDANNYILGNTTASALADITKKDLSVTITVADKVYDGNTTATIGERVPVGLISPDVIDLSGGTAVFSDAIVGNNKPVTATGVIIEGTDAGNYEYNGTATGTGNILPVPTTVYVDDDFSEEGGAGDYTFGYNAFDTIQGGINAVEVGGTVNVAAGNYTEVEQIVIDKNLSIVGENKETTIIKPAQNTTNTGHADSAAWILVNSDKTFNLSKVTLDGNGHLIAIGILSHGHGTINDNIFTNIAYNPSGPDYKGMAIELYGSDMTIENNEFANIGRIGVFNGNGTNSHIIGNTYTGKGAGDWLDYGFEVGRGSQSEISNNIITNNIGVASDGSTSAGILVTSFFGPGISNATITGNSISNSTDGIAVGYDGSDASIVVAHTNKFSGNTKDINSTKPSVDGTRNWWGTISGTEIANKVVGDVSYRPWCTEVTCTVIDTNGAPTVTISSVAGSLTKTSPIPITVTFSEPVYDFNESDVTVSLNAGVTNFSEVSGSTSYTFDLTPNVGVDEGEITVDVAAEKAWDEAGNYNLAATQFVITYDSVIPTLSSVSISSNNINHSLAKVGDIITLSFTADEEIQNPTVIIASNSITATNSIGNDWTAVYTMQSGDAEIVSFEINFNDLAGNAGTKVTATTDLSSVTFDETAPVVAITSPLNETRVNGDTLISFTDTSTSPKCSVNNNSWTVCESGVTKLSDIAQFSGLGQGIFTLYLKDIDEAGNEGTTSVSLIKDSIAPEVESYTPTNLAVGVDPTGNVTALFSEKMSLATINSTNIELKKSGEVTEVETDLTLSEDGKTLTINPVATLLNNSTYEVRITTGVTDEAGNNLASEETWSFTTSGSYSFTLSKGTKGWNLVSLGVVPNDTNIDAVLGSAKSNIESVWTYDPVNYSLNGGWKVYNPAESGTSSLLNMTAGYGYWISYKGTEAATVSGPGNLVLEGNNVPPSRTLQAGWNLIGYYQKENTTSVLASLALKHNLDDYWTMLLGYNNTTKQMTSLTGDNLLNPGEGYWVLLDGKATDSYIYTIGDSQ
ncbi:MAG: YDG domain-containing protein [Candidatus Paceibacterota bacterium]